MKYHFITQHKKILPVTVMCQVLGVCRSGYYHFVIKHNTYQPDAIHLEMVEWVMGREIGSKSKSPLKCLPASTIFSQFHQLYVALVVTAVVGALILQIVGA